MAEGDATGVTCSCPSQKTRDLLLQLAVREPPSALRQRRVPLSTQPAVFSIGTAMSSACSSGVPLSRSRRRQAPSIALPFAATLLLPGSLLFASRAAAQTAAQQAGELSSPATFSYSYLGAEREDFCSVAPNKPPKLDELADYPAVPPESQDNAGTRLLVQSFRGENQLALVAQKCQFAASSAEPDPECDSALSAYTGSLTMFMLPVAMGVAVIVIWHLCCWVACCRCCRRCCLCAERKGPRHAKAWQKFVGFFMVVIGSGAVAITALVCFQRSGSVNGGLTDMLCFLMTMTDETLNGSPVSPTFLGVDLGIHRLQMVRRLLDVDGRSMLDVRAILDETASFASAMDDLMAKIEHMQRVLTLIGQRKIKDHRCVFCELAVGNNATGQSGLLSDLVLEIKLSSADAMRSIQIAATDSLTGRPLAETSNAVRRGGLALEAFRNGYASAFVERLVSQARDFQSWEDSRYTFFMVLCGFCLIHVGGISGYATYHASRSTAKYPSPALSCAAWFFGFCIMSLALLFGGGLLLVAIPMSELCHFSRYDLLTHDGIADYYWQLGLVDTSKPARPMDPLAVDVFRSCLTPNGTGDIIGSLQLTQKLSFQQTLDDKFVQLDEVVGRVVDNEKFELLVARADAFGGLFVLDPDEKLPLDPAAAPKMMGSSLDPDDQEGPDGVSLIYGLNTYAGLIGGAGRYSFAHGTSGGGTIITATTPSEAETSSQPLQVRHALIYAKLKEQIHTELNILRCDDMDSAGKVTERACSYEEYKDWVRDWARKVRTAGVRLGEESQEAYPLIASDLRFSLRSLMLEVRELRTLFRCRFVWRRWEEMDFHLCNTALPSMLESTVAWTMLAGSVLLLLLMHYKIWRHLLDNRIVGEELEKYSKKYGYLQTKA